jgi:hypothetical protein
MSTAASELDILVGEADALDAGPADLEQLCAAMQAGPDRLPGTALLLLLSKTPSQTRWRARRDGIYCCCI